MLLYLKLMNGVIIIGSLRYDDWRPIKGYPGYEINPFGEVRSYKDHQGGIGPESHPLKANPNANGYMMVTLFDENHKSRRMSVHRILAKTFMPDYDESWHVDHVDTDKTNNRLDNLEWVTPKENSIRAVKNGLYEPIFAKTRRPVMVTDLRTNETTYYIGVNEAARAIRYSPAAVCKVASCDKDRVGHYFIEYAGREERLLYGGLE